MASTVSHWARMAKGAGLAVAAAALLHVATAQAETLPGKGETVAFAQGDWLGANYVQSQIIDIALETLGYKPDLKTLASSAFLQAAAQGDLAFAADLNFPQREPAFKKVEGEMMTIGTGAIIEGGINGYLIDRKTAEAHGITNVEQLKDPKIAALFDTDGDGKANLVSCDPGWSCGDVVNHQIKAFGLADTVEAVQGKYEPLMAESVARVQRGQPTLYYAWSPSWVMDALVPGKDVVWLPVPFDSLPEGMNAGGRTSLIKGVVGCAGGADPCHMAIGAWTYQAVANRAFAAKHPDVVKLLEVARWPIATWSAWEAKINQDGSNNRDIRKLAKAWIAEHQAEFDGWIAEAKAASK